MKQLSSKMGFKLTALPLVLTATQEIAPSALNKQLATMKTFGVDFIYLGSSSLIRKNGAMFTAAALHNQLPTLSPYEHLVRNSDALLSVAAKYSDVGELAAKQMEKILFEQHLPSQLPVFSVEKYAYVINMRVAKALNQFPSVNILQYAETINP